MAKRCCEGCAYAVRLKVGEQELLVCAGRPETPGQLTVVQPSGTCRRFLKRRSISGRLTPPEPHDGICYIALTKGKFAIVDAADYERVNAHVWHAAGSVGRPYACCRCNGKHLSMHRFLMNPPAGLVVDHIDGNGLNNRRSNLRICTQGQNSYNSRPRGRSSKYKGVRWDKSRNRWTAHVRCNGHSYYLGRFREEIDAARAYDRKAYELFGEFAWLNFPEELRGPGGQASWMPQEDDEPGGDVDARAEVVGDEFVLEDDELAGDIDLQEAERPILTRRSQADAIAAEPNRFSLTPGSLLNLGALKDTGPARGGGDKPAGLARRDAVRRFILCPYGHTASGRRLLRIFHHGRAEPGLGRIGSKSPSAGFLDSRPRSGRGQALRGNDVRGEIVSPASP